MVNIILWVFALVLFILAGVGIPSNRFNLIGLGLACAAATHLTSALP